MDIFASEAPTSLTGALIYVMCGAFGMVVVALIGLAGNWALNRSRAGNEDASAAQARANARKTDAEVWGLMNGDLERTVERLGQSLEAMHQKFDGAMDHIVAVHEWDARGRLGPMPLLPAELAHTA